MVITSEDINLIKNWLLVSEENKHVFNEAVSTFVRRWVESKSKLLKIFEKYKRGQRLTNDEIGVILEYAYDCACEFIENFFPGIRVENIYKDNKQHSLPDRIDVFSVHGVEIVIAAELKNYRQDYVSSRKCVYRNVVKRFNNVSADIKRIVHVKLVIGSLKCSKRVMRMLEEMGFIVCVISESQILTFEAFIRAVENIVIIVLFIVLVKLLEDAIKAFFILLEWLENSANSESVMEKFESIMEEFDNMINRFISNMKRYLKKQRKRETIMYAVCR